MQYATPNNPQSTLVDPFGRVVDYLRISVTDRCDFRCVYCMDDEMTFVPRARILTLEEIATVAATFVSLGVKKIRITGGEPFVRRNVIKLLQDLGGLAGLKQLTVTTNGSQLTAMAQSIRAAGVNRINISLDTLDAERFRRITRHGDLSRVLAGIDAALAAGFQGVKINAVILKHQNDDEIIPLTEFASTRGMDISFIEEMPLGVVGEHDRAAAYYSSDQIRDDLSRRFTLIPTTETTGGPSRYYRLAETGTRVGFISPHSHNFCETCNRVRLTAEGRLLLCLGQEHSVDLKQVVRAHPGNVAALREAIREAMLIKPRGHDFRVQTKPVIFRHMNVTGG